MAPSSSLGDSKNNPVNAVSTVTVGPGMGRERWCVDPAQRPPPAAVPPDIPRERDIERIVAGFVGVAVAAALFLGMARPRDVVAPPARADTETESAATIVVHVAGAVRRPGVYQLDAGARVADAIEAAGGALRAADLASVNFAAPAVDGAQILVAGTSPRVPAGVAVPAATIPAQVNLNTADQITLESLPGVGPVTAAAILDQRAAIGAFTSLDQLLEIDGIGPATVESLRPYVTL